MTIRQTGAKGDFVDTLLQVVALDDIVGLVAYSIAISVAVGSTSGSFSFKDVVIPIIINIGILLLGAFFGVIMKLLMTQKRTKDNRLIIAIALIFAFCGLCAILGQSPLLGCMAMGTIYINTTDDDKLFKQLNYFSPPILLLFFVRSGLNFKLDALVSSTGNIGSVPLIVVGILYFIVRIIGKYGGAYLGCLSVKKDKSVRNYLGLALIPQAGVAIGLAALGARTLGGEQGQDLETIILASSVLYELIGPACAKLSLYLSKSYSNNIEDITTVQELNEDGTKKTPVVLHRAILGSLDRFMAYILEETKGNLPLWLAPVQARIIPVKNEDEELNAYSHELLSYLDENGIRVEIDERAEKLGYRVRAAQVEKVPYLIILGKNEVKDGTVEIKSIAREAGSRTKIAVWSNNPNVDAVGACVGMNGARVNAIVEELRGEKIDIVNWDENPGNLIQNALSPAKIVAVFADPDEKTAKVVVPDYQLSLAIGKEGQNARLAARLTGYKIDIKSETQAKDAPGFRYEDYVDDYEDETEDDFDGEQE